MSDIPLMNQVTAAKVKMAEAMETLARSAAAVMGSTSKLSDATKDDYAEMLGHAASGASLGQELIEAIARETA